MLVGADYYWYEYLEVNRFFDGPPFVTGSINIFDPVYDTTVDEGFKASQVPPTGSFGARQNWYGVYVQDQIALGQQWHLLAGLRYDHARTTQLRDFPTQERPTDDAQQLSPRLGLLYRPVSWLSVFGSYTRGFNVPTFAQSPEPQRARQYEVGFKVDALEGRLTGTMTFFDLIKTNISTPTGIPNVFDLSGEVRNRGVELDVRGTLTNNWRVIGSFSYIDSEITEDRDPSGGSGNEGNRLTSVPSYTGSLWSVYDFGRFGWPGLSTGAGAFFVSQRQGDNANTFRLPGYARVDLMVGYARRVGPSRVSLQLNVQNLLDKKYFATSNNRNNVMPGAPRTLLGQVRVSF